MADRERDRKEEEKRDHLGNVLLGLGIGALAGAAVFAAARAFSGSEEEEVPFSSSSSSHYQSHSLGASHRTPLVSFNHSSSWQEQGEDSTIIIAVDATPSRAGGLLVLPRQKEVYMYSIDWFGQFSFVDEPDKFEMVNALLALYIFEEYIESYRRDAPVLLKTDSNFCINPTTGYAGLKNEGWRDLFRTVDAKLKNEPFEGKWDYCSKSSDVYIRVADKLSRANHSQSSTFPQMGNMTSPFFQYSVENVSDGHDYLLRQIAKLIPKTSRAPEASGNECAQT